VFLSSAVPPPSLSAEAARDPYRAYTQADVDDAANWFHQYCPPLPCFRLGPGLLRPQTDEARKDADATDEVDEKAGIWEVERLMIAARKETEVLEKKMNGLVKKNRKIFMAGMAH
jgi:hypothetical protein